MSHPFRPFRLALQLAWQSILLVAAPASAGPHGFTPGQELTPLHWRFEAAGGRSAAASAVARGPGERWATGGERGVAVRDGAGVWRRLPLGSPVRDLSFAADASLWIATAGGLWQLAPESQHPIERTPARGEAARPATRVLAAAGWVALAAGEGVFWSRSGESWGRIDAAPGAFPAAGLALQPIPGGSARLWIAGRGGLFRAVLGRLPKRVSARREPLPGHPRFLADVAIGEGRIWVLAADRLLVGSPPPAGDDRELPAGGLPTSPQPAPRVWQVDPLSLPAGSQPTRFAVGDSGLWIATDRGLLRASDPRGSWRRAASPAGATAAAALAFGPGGVAVATPRGLLRGISAAAETGIPVVSPQREPCDPSIQRLQRAVLAHHALGGRPLERLRRGVRRSGYAPELRIQASYGSDWDLSHRYDQAFISGDKRFLFDSNEGRGREREISVALTWRLSTLFYHPEEIDISGEARRLIELRDDILDEVNQLYFDRRRALAVARAAASPAPPAAAAELRGEELAAGLDAWSAGWFSRFRAHCLRASGAAP